MAEQANDALQVWVIYATPQDEFVQPMRVAPGTTIGQAIEGSGVLSQLP
jgi:putative ubiquitin-RnfH superfamily antitoxin RatB of RatAB toxin-antitoxin module